MDHVILLDLVLAAAAVTVAVIHAAQTADHEVMIVVAVTVVFHAARALKSVALTARPHVRWQIQWTVLHAQRNVLLTVRHVQNTHRELKNVPQEQKHRVPKSVLHVQH